MKAAALIETINKRKTVLVGAFQGYKVDELEKGGVNEKFSVVVGDTVIPFTRWAPKGTKLEQVKPPGFVDKIGSTVVVIGASIKLDGKYLRSGCETVELLEP